ncbi:MAG: hypothetical protein AAGU11_05300 [Syntrophobacteraceae bacterium]
MKLPRIVPITVALVLLMILPLIENLRAEQRPSLKGEGITIFYDQSVSNQAQSLRYNYSELRSQVEKKIGWKLKSKPTVYLIGTENGFRKMGGNDSMAAFTLIGKARIVINLASFDRFIGFDHTFRHELCHVLLHDHIRRRLPDWTEEGICEWVGGLRRYGIARIEDIFGAFSLYRHGAPLAKLRDFSGAHTGIRMAYIQSGSFIGFVSDRYGEDGIRRILGRLKSGDTVDRAFQNGLSKPLKSVESEWRQELENRAKWLILIQEGVEQAGSSARMLLRVLIANRETAIFYLVIVILLFGSIRIVTKARRR